MRGSTHKLRLWPLLGVAAFIAAATPLRAEPFPADLLAAKGIDGFVTVERLPLPEDAQLLEGRAVWEETCQNCHGGNRLTGAPKITATDAWAPRIEQGLAVLFDHAINGFTGPKYTQMPPRGGNDDLSDAQVQAAVRFMVWASGGDVLATE